MKYYMKLTKIYIISVMCFLITIIECSLTKDTNNGQFRLSMNTEQLLDSLITLNEDENQLLIRGKIDTLWHDLQDSNSLPFVDSTHILFLYRGEAESVAWAGDFNGWMSDSTISGMGTKLENLDIWYFKIPMPYDARIDYKIVVNEKNWILDPDNRKVQMSGYGPNSEIAMPGYCYSSIVIRDSTVKAGTISDNFVIHSAFLNYDVQFQVYTPAEYDTNMKYPVLYVTDGHEYADDLRGGLVVALDNMIAMGMIKPLIAVFIDPRNPDNLHENRRFSEYIMNPLYLNFISDEFITIIDENFVTLRSAEGRAILGTSLGGLFAAYAGITRSDTFGKIAINSPAFSIKSEIYDLYESEPTRPLRIFMSSGTIHDTKEAAQKMLYILKSKDYTVHYIETNQGHSWGNWKSLIDNVLLYFYGVTAN